MQTTCIATTGMVFYSLSILVPSKKDFNMKRERIGFPGETAPRGTQSFKPV